MLLVFPVDLLGNGGSWNCLVGKVLLRSHVAWVSARQYFEASEKERNSIRRRVKSIYRDLELDD